MLIPNLGLAQSYIRASQYNPLNQGNNSCDTGGMFVSNCITLFSCTPLNSGNSVFTPPCLRDPYIRLYFGTYYAVYSEGETYVDIATASSLTGTWTRINQISIGTTDNFGVNVPNLLVDENGVVHIIVWDAIASEWWEIHPSTADPSTFSSAWSTKANILDHNGSVITGLENIFITRYNNGFYLLSAPQSGGSHLTLRTSTDVMTGWSDASTLSIPNPPVVFESEVPIFLGTNLAVPVASDDTKGQVVFIAYYLNTAGSTGTWLNSITVSPTDSYSQITPVTDMACGTAAQFYQPPYVTAPSSGLCDVGSASSVTRSGTQWTWTCTLNANTANCSANTPAAFQHQINNATINNAGIKAS